MGHKLHTVYIQFVYLKETSFIYEHYYADDNIAV